MTLGVTALTAVALLIAWEVSPRLFPAKAHEFLAALPLALVAFGYFAHKASHKPTRSELVEAALFATAFLFWAANQFWADRAPAALFNDIAIALFVLDAFLVMVGWSSNSPSREGAERTLGSH
ncbi:MAG: hypothetical protein ACLP1X_16805 [Polyangiaceae bacterium]|jgi:hypothetical protein